MKIIDKFLIKPYAANHQRSAYLTSYSIGNYGGENSHNNPS
jgi:hypothetical protein